MAAEASANTGEQITLLFAKIQAINDSPGRLVGRYVRERAQQDRDRLINDLARIANSCCAIVREGS